FPDRSKRRVRPIAVTSMPELSPELEEMVEEYKTTTAEYFVQDPNVLNVTNEHLNLAAEIKRRCAAEGLNPKDKSRVMDELAMASNCSRQMLYKLLKKSEQMRAALDDNDSDGTGDFVDAKLAEVPSTKPK
uniref:Uncharacterized protein n=1 Tax=Plectus sambesii TaxID=2011161 RepID=A0A914WYP1_9BILA